MDDVNGGVLDSKLVKVAREVELQWIKKMQVYELVDEKEAREKTGRQPISVRWVDTNKGDDQVPNYRSRLVAQEVRTAGQRVLPDAQLFSSMPPLEALKVLCSLMVSMKVSKVGVALKIGVIDISRAHFYGKAKRDVYIKLPEEEQMINPGKCGKLLRSMYGTQDASSCWKFEYVGVLKLAGFQRGAGYGALFCHPIRDICLFVHGDDFVILADMSGQAFVEQTLGAHY